MTASNAPMHHNRAEGADELQPPATFTARRQVQRMRRIAEILRRMRLPRRSIVALLGAMSFGAGLATVASLQSGSVVNALIARNFSAVALAIFLLALSDVLCEISNHVGNYVTASVYHLIRMNVEESLFAKAQQLPLSDVVSGAIGEMYSRVTADADAFASLVCYVLSPLIQSILAITAAVIFMLHASAPLAIASLAFTPIWFILLARQSGRLESLRNDIFKHSDRHRADVADALSIPGLIRVKSFEGYEFDRARLRAVNSKLCSLNLAWFRGTARKSASLNISAGLLGHISTLTIGSILVSQHRIDVGTLVSFLVLIGRLYGPLKALGTSGVTFAASAVVVDRVVDMLSRQPQVSGSRIPARGDLLLTDAEISFDGRLICESATVCAGASEWIAIIGDNGCGKTTIMRLLPRLLDCVSGAASYGGTPLEEVSLSNLRERVIMLPQHDSLFTGTIRENVAYGRAYTDSQIWQALETVEIAERVRQHPAGLEFRVRPLGTDLSSGERQRIALARALLRSPEVLIIDEATSNIDSACEARILARMRTLDVTVVFTAHRDTHLDFFDHVVRVQQDGTSLVRSKAARRTVVSVNT